MKQKLSSRAISHCLWMGALLCSATLVPANVLLTFQVDMSAQAGTTFTNGVDTVSVHGTFDGWGSGLQLTNDPAGANSNLFTGTFNDMTDTNGMVVQFKYVEDNSTYETTASGNNRCAQLPAANGASLLLPVSFFDDAGTPVTTSVTFQVDMSEQINIGTFDPNADSVEVRGGFNGWAGGASPLVADPSINTTNSQGLVTSNVYTGTFPVTASPGAAEEYKYVIQPATVWDSPSSADDNVYSGNRFFANVTQTLPIVYFNDTPLSESVTNDVKFEIDLSVQEAIGAFTNGNPDSQIEIHGDFNGWGAGVDLTNDPALNNTNIFVADIEYIGAPGTTENYKYVLQPGTQWENVPGGGNRTFMLHSTNGSFVEGPDLFSFEGPSALDDIVYTPDCMVTFTVNMTNAVGTDGTIFDPSQDTVYINGLNNGNNNSFWTWGVLNAPPQFQMTNSGSSLLYSVTVPVNQGQNIDLVYKYSINGADNEAGFADNHMRYIRSQPDYTMPVDTFGAQGASSTNEPSFGDLTITNSGSQITLSWLGRQHVHLQTASTLGGPWTVLPATDGTNLIVAPGGIATTNYSIGAGNKFYELVYP